MLISLEGTRKTGKSTFCFSAPKKIVLFDFDFGLDRIESRFLPPKEEIFIHPFQEITILNKKKQDKFVIAQWEAFLKSYNDALEDSSVATIAMDTFTAVWELRRVSWLAEMRLTEPSRKNLMPQEYAKPNADMNMLLVQAKMHHKNLVLTHHLRETYRENKPTGEYEADGFKHTGDFVDIVLQTGKNDNKPLFTIKDCGLTMRAEGLQIPEPTWEKVETLITKLRNL